MALGELAKVHWNTIQKAETGGGVVTDTLEKLAGALGCEPGDFFVEEQDGDGSSSKQGAA